MRRFLPETMTENFFVYNGSLTYPGCNEEVIFILSDETSSVSAWQMSQLRFASSTTFKNESMSPNSREVQPRNDRIVVASFQNPEWDYRNFTHWDDFSTRCSQGREQSPINLPPPVGSGGVAAIVALKMPYANSTFHAKGVNDGRILKFAIDVVHYETSTSAVLKSSLLSDVPTTI